MFGSYSMSFHLIIVEITTKTKCLACSVFIIDGKLTSEVWNKVNQVQIPMFSGSIDNKALVCVLRCAVTSRQLQLTPRILHIVMF